MDAFGQDRLVSKFLTESELASSGAHTSMEPTTTAENTSTASPRTAKNGLRKTQGELPSPAVGTGAVTEAGGGGVLITPTDGVESAQDSEEEDMFFLIPSVLAGTKSAPQFAVAQESVIPRIDLQSQVFRTRVHSAQLGPGSSLSTPTTGGGGRYMRGGGGGVGGLRSEQSIAAMFSDRSSARQSSSPLAVSLNTVAVLPRTLGSSVMGATSIVAKVSPRLRAAPCNNPIAGSATEGVLNDDIKIAASALVNERLCSDNAGKLEDPSSHEEVLNYSSHRGSEPRRLSAQSRGSESTCGNYSAPPAAAVADSGLVRTQGAAAAADGDKGFSGNSPEQAYRGVPYGSSPRPGSGVCVMRRCAIDLLLSMALSTSGVSTEPRCPVSSNLTATGQWGQDHLVPGVMATAIGQGGREDLLADVMVLLQAYFDCPKNAYTVLNLKIRWRAGVSMAEAAPAVLAKLVCAALFDAKSYSLDGRHIAAGRSGGVIVSRCPLPLGEETGCLTRATPTESTAFKNEKRAKQSPTKTSAEYGTSENGKRVNKTPANSLQTPPLPSKASYRRDEDDKTPEKSPTTTLQTSSLSSSGSYGCDKDEVALKVVDKNDLDRNLGPAVFAEVLALRALSDVPGVCRLYDFGVTLDSYVLVMERCRFSLKDWRVARGGAGGGDGWSGGGGGGRVGVRGEGGGWGRGRGGGSDGDDGGQEAIGAPRFDQEAALYLLVFRQIASAAAAMAERGIIHFDLKCDNVLVRGRRHTASPAASFGMGGLEDVPSVCLADFGESAIGQRRRVSESNPHVRGETSSGSESDRFEFDIRSARGTERIQSPEMILMTSSGGDVGKINDHSFPTSGRASDSSRENKAVSKRVTTASDVWSLGCLLYELLTTKLLFEDLQWSEFFVTLTSGETDGGRSAGVVGRRIPKPLLPPPGTLPFDALRGAKAIRTLLESMLVRNPTDRPSASQTVENIDNTLTIVVPESTKASVGAEAGGAEACTSLSVNTEANFVDSLTPRAVVGTSLPAAADKNIVGSLSPGDSPMLNSETPKRCAAAGSEESYPGSGAVARKKSSAAQDDPRKRTEGRRATLTESPTTAETTWPMQPCVAALLHRGLAARQSALLGCAGILCPLGAGAFLLEVNGQSDLGAGTGRERSNTRGGCTVEDTVEDGNGKPGGGSRPGDRKRNSKSDYTIQDEKVRAESMAGGGGVLSAGGCVPGGGVNDPKCARSDEPGRFGAGMVGYREISGGSVCNPSYARSDESGLELGPGMMVGCATSCQVFAFIAEENNSAGFTARPLGRVLSALGISHVVCVMPGRQGQGKDSVARGSKDPQGQGKGTRKGEDPQFSPGKGSTVREFEDPQLHPSRLLDGSRLLCVTIPVEDVDNGEDAENGGNGENGVGESGDAVFPSPAFPPARLLEGVIEFVTGPRVLFVGMEGTGDGASALAVAWAMARTGRGAYETVLDFRQSCVGFWINPSALRIGRNF